jgi:4-diphosphocytidyl-2-C-methyl-D-erythritol kinase
MNLNELAPLKINLFLHILGQRYDGYHLLQSVFVFADVGDNISYQPSLEPLTLKIVGPFAAHLSNNEDNLVLRAARLLNPAATGKLQLTKHIPIASGLGGGSADAAATLRLLNRAWQYHHDDAYLRKISAPLGADVPACISSRPVLVSGIGEILDDLLSGATLFILLANPNIATSTPDVFRAYQALGAHFTPPLPDWPLATYDWRLCRNDLTAAAKIVTPEISNVIECFSGLESVKLTRMAGSGASCFALFDTEVEMEQAKQIIKRRFPNWWLQSAKIVTPVGQI